jgi:hypothetical protein
VALRKQAFSPYFPCRRYWYTFCIPLETTIGFGFSSKKKDDAMTQSKRKQRPVSGIGRKRERTEPDTCGNDPSGPETEKPADEANNLAELAKSYQDAIRIYETHYRSSAGDRASSNGWNPAGVEAVFPFECDADLTALRTLTEELRNACGVFETQVKPVIAGLPPEMRVEYLDNWKRYFQELRAAAAAVLETQGDGDRSPASNPAESGADAKT